MEFPSFTIDGTVYTMEEPKARMWRIWMKFDAERGNLDFAEVIDKHAAMIAEVFPCEDHASLADKILDNLDLSEVFRLYRDCRDCLLKLITAKLGEIEKNVPEGEGEAAAR